MNAPFSEFVLGYCGAGDIIRVKPEDAAALIGSGVGIGYNTTSPTIAALTLDEIRRCDRCAPYSPACLLAVKAIMSGG